MKCQRQKLSPAFFVVRTCVYDKASTHQGPEFDWEHESLGIQESVLLSVVVLVSDSLCTAVMRFPY